MSDSDEQLNVVHISNVSGDACGIILSGMTHFYVSYFHG